MTTQHLPEVHVGDSLRFEPDRRCVWWRVVARNERHVVAIRQAAFEPRGTVEYTVTGETDYRYNGEGPGLIRSSLNALGGGWDIEPDGSDAQGVIDALESGEFRLSDRRRLGVRSVTIRDRG